MADATPIPVQWEPLNGAEVLRVYQADPDGYYPQIALLRKMVRDLDMDVEIIVCPIVRESDGLAMSSRNAYLNPEQRQQALVLSRSLLEVKAAVDAGERDVGMLAEIGRRAIASEPAAKLDYLAIVDPDTLDPIDKVSQGTLIAVAVWLGATRLIDNILL